jgi:hypothetical protein
MAIPAAISAGVAGGTAIEKGVDSIVDHTKGKKSELKKGKEEENEE